MPFSESKYMNDDEFVLRLLKLIEEKVDMLPDTYIKRTYAEDIVQNCFVSLWQEYKKGILNKSFWAFAEVCAYYGVRSEYMHYCNRGKNEILCGQIPQNSTVYAVWAENAFIPKNFVYEQWLDLSFMRRKRAARHHISFLRYTGENGWQQRRVNWEFHMPRLTEFFAILPIVFIVVNVRGDEAYRNSVLPMKTSMFMSNRSASRRCIK